MGVRVSPGAPSRSQARGIRHPTFRASPPNGAKVAAEPPPALFLPGGRKIRYETVCPAVARSVAAGSTGICAATRCRVFRRNAKRSGRGFRHCRGINLKGHLDLGGRVKIRPGRSVSDHTNHTANEQISEGRADKFRRDRDVRRLIAGLGAANVDIILRLRKRHAARGRVNGTKRRASPRKRATCPRRRCHNRNAFGGAFGDGRARTEHGRRKKDGKETRRHGVLPWRSKYDGASIVARVAVKCCRPKFSLRRFASGRGTRIIDTLAAPEEQ